MGVITGYSRRTAAIGSGGGGGAINTIYSASDTIIDDARTVTLKSGGTASQYFQILNSGGGNLLQLSGNKSINFGSTTSFVQPNIYLDSTLNDQFTIFRGSSYFVNVNPLTWQLEVRGSASKYVYINGDSARILAQGNSSGVILKNASGVDRAFFTLQSGNGLLALNDSSGTRKVNLEVGSTAVISLNTQIGGLYNDSLTAQFTVKGSGTTSATTTALFQNSASVSALKIKDDLYCIFRAKDAAIPDGDLSNNELSFYIEEATNDLHFKVKFSTGTVKSGKINLT